MVIDYFYLSLKLIISKKPIKSSSFYTDVKDMKDIWKLEIKKLGNVA